MTREQAQELRYGDRVRDVTCGREGTVTEVPGDFHAVEITFDRLRPDGGEWLGRDKAMIDVREFDFLEKIEAEVQRLDRI